MGKNYQEKLEELIADRDSEQMEWRQSNEEVSGFVESEVTFKFKKPLQNMQKLKD